eukprot:Gb_26395 [translate_table: standard]
MPTGSVMLLDCCTVSNCCQQVVLVKRYSWCQTKVLTESDKLPSELKSKAAEEFRHLGIPCSVYYLSFDKWILALQSQTCQGSTQHRKEASKLCIQIPRGFMLFLQIDKDFQLKEFEVDLYGRLSGSCHPLHFSYRFNGRHLVAHLSMLEQTALYRQGQKMRHSLGQNNTSVDKAVDGSSAQSLFEAEGTSTLSKQGPGHEYYIPGCSKDHELTAIISKNCELRCIVLTVITLDAPWERLQALMHPVNGSNERNLLDVKNVDSNPLCISSTRMHRVGRKEMGQTQKLHSECFQNSATVNPLPGPKVSQHAKKKGSRGVKSRKSRSGHVLDSQTTNASLEFSSSSHQLDNSHASSSTKQHKESSKSDSSLKRASKKKKRKKGKRNLKNTDSGQLDVVHEESAQESPLSGSGVNEITSSGSGQILVHESPQDAVPFDTSFNVNYRNDDDVKAGETNTLAKFTQDAKDPLFCTTPKGIATAGHFSCAHASSNQSSLILSSESSGTEILQLDNYGQDYNKENSIRNSVQIHVTTGQNITLNAQIEESIHQQCEKDNKKLCHPIECVEETEMTGIASFSRCKQVRHCTDQPSTCDGEESFKQSRDAKGPCGGANSRDSVDNTCECLCETVNQGKAVPGFNGKGSGTASTNSSNVYGKSSFQGSSGLIGNFCGSSGGISNSRVNFEMEKEKDIVDVDNNRRLKHSAHVGGGQETQADSFERKVRVAGCKKMSGNTPSLENSSSGSSHSCGVVNTHSRLGKENNHSVWQRVQRNIGDDHVYEPGATHHVQLQSDVASQNGSLVVNNATAESNTSEQTLSTCSQKYSNDNCHDKEQNLKEQEIYHEHRNSQGHLVPYDVHSRITLQMDPPRSQVRVDDNSVHTLTTQLKERQNAGNMLAHTRETGKGFRAKKTGSSRPDMPINFCQKGAVDVSQQTIRPKSFHAGDRNVQYVSHRKADNHHGDQRRSSSAPSTPLSHVDMMHAHRDIFSSARSSAPIQGALDQMLPLSRTSVDQAVQLTKHCGNQMTSAGRISEIQLGFDGSSFHSPHWKGSKGTDLEDMVSFEKISKQDCLSQLFSQKWVPVETKSTGAARAITTDKVGTDTVDNISSSRRVEDGRKKKYDSSGQTMASSDDPCITHTSTKNNVQKGASENNALHAPDDVHGSEVTIEETNWSNSCKAEQTTEISHDCNIRKMTQAVLKSVSASYQYEIASKDIAYAVGSPLAEFEKVLHSVSPVIEPVSHIERCVNHCRNKLLRNSVCRCQIADIPLENIWHWYEKPGNYGLEVRAEDFQCSGRLSIDGNKFRAYFVPFLSGIQLFGFTTTTKSCCESAWSTVRKERNKGREKDENSYLPQFGNLPILSTLLPKPSTAEATDIAVCSGEMNASDPSACDGNHSCNILSEDLDCGDIEILFEYFESEQPQQRRPMFEKIKELTKIGARSSSEVLGDAHILESANLHDLHPASWFSVAWYPIYRIPEGHLRAAFLTYHSLGHFVHRSTSSFTLDGHMDCSIVSPVVGLQSYNTQASHSSTAQQGNNCVFLLQSVPSLHLHEILFVWKLIFAELAVVKLVLSRNHAFTISVCLWDATT